MRTSLQPYRFWIINSVIILAMVLLLYQLLQLTYFRRETLKNLADRQHQLRIDISPHRGSIYDRQGKELAVNLRVPSVYAVPRLLNREKRQTMIDRLNSILALGRDFLNKQLSKDKAFVWLKRGASLEESKAVKSLATPAVGLVHEFRRYYPNQELLAHVLGFTDIDNRGLEGIELFRDDDLSGRKGNRYTRRDALGREIRAFESQFTPAIDGNHVTLTIDQHIQFLTERALDGAYKKWNAKGAWAVVLNPKTGEILAIANRPAYNPNQYSASKTETRRNRAITDLYEPGSVFKIVAVSAALNENLVTPESVFYCEKGKYAYGAKVLHDVHPYGDLPVEQILVKSSNIGTVKIAAKLKPEIFHSYVRSYGFGDVTGVDFPGEVRGVTIPPNRWSKTSPYNIPIGHEILVTGIQLASAMAVIANDGKLMRPYIMAKTEDKEGVTLHRNRPFVKKEVIRPEVALTMRQMLVKAVEEGTGKPARLEKILVGGKTGTAQKVLPSGGYSHSNFMSSFVGFAPAEDPQLVMVVTLDDPRPKYYGGTVAAPVFKEVVEAALIHLNYVPDRQKAWDKLMNPPVSQESLPMAQ